VRVEPGALLSRLEGPVFGLFLAAWLVTGLGQLGFLELAGRFGLSFYGFYSAAAALGWLAGNFYMARRRGRQGDLVRRLRAMYFLQPLSLVFLLWTLGPKELQRAAPLVPLYAVGVYGALYLVPVMLSRMPLGR
jgi:hypothetical protein